MNSLTGKSPAPRPTSECGGRIAFVFSIPKGSMLQTIYKVSRYIDDNTDN